MIQTFSEVTSTALPRLPDLNPFSYYMIRFPAEIRRLLLIHIFIFSQSLVIKHIHDMNISSFRVERGKIRWRGNPVEKVYEGLYLKYIYQ